MGVPKWPRLKRRERRFSGISSICLSTLIISALRDSSITSNGKSPSVLSVVYNNIINKKQQKNP